MTDYLRLADARVLLWLNHALAAHPRLYLVSLFTTDQLADVAFGLTCLVLWFWPERLRGFREVEPEAAPLRSIARRVSRARLIVFGIGGMTAYVLARLIAVELDRPRPFAAYLPVTSPVAGAFEGLRAFGSFPSDHAALLAALPLGFAFWSARLGQAWTLAALLLMVVRVAVGFHYPLDMLAGGVIGAVSVTLAMAVFDRHHGVHDVALRVADGFARPPYAYVLYGALGLGALEFAAHFRHVLGVLLWIRARVAGA